MSKRRKHIHSPTIHLKIVLFFTCCTARRLSQFWSQARGLPAANSLSLLLFFPCAAFAHVFRKQVSFPTTIHYPLVSYTHSYAMFKTTREGLQKTAFGCASPQIRYFDCFARLSLLSRCEQERHSRWMCVSEYVNASSPFVVSSPSQPWRALFVRSYIIAREPLKV